MCYAEHRDDPYLALVRALYGADARHPDRRTDAADTLVGRNAAGPKESINPTAEAAPAVVPDRLAREASY